ncbi:SGNH/GDSL hydrolase family protein [Streptomyces sp. NPDC059649]|uniref:SGNH/GDSL hydrolase family protein n=1 Tax=Streptomyces sp. NPDC059649 TaxID=3346895 RepID=UPI0036C66A3E
MARHSFGGSPADIAMERVSSALVIRGGASGTVWDAATGGNQLTDLTDMAGNAITQIVSDDNGGVQFYGPDTVTRCWVDFGFGRYLMQANDLGADVEALRTSVNSSISTLTTAVSGVLSQTTVDAKGDLLVGSANDAIARLGVGASGQQLVADSLAATGVRWSNAWRRRHLPDQLTVDSLSTLTPTMTTTQQSTSTIASAQALLPPDTGPFLYLGAGSFTYGTGVPDSSYYLPTSRYPNTYASGQANWAVSFWTDASQFEIKFKYVSSTATMYRLTVDGRKMTDLMQSSGGTTVGSSHVLKVNFGSSTPRLIRFDFTTMPFGGLFLAPGATAWKPSSRGGRLGILGDSISDGSAQNTGAGCGTWTYRVARLLGCDDVWDQARGGTGYITPGSYAVFGDRVAGDITPYSFDRLIVSGGYNDNGGSQSSIASAAASLFTALKAAVAVGGEIYVIGCHSPTGSPATSITNTDNTIKAAATSAGLPFISPLSGSVYDGAGTLVTTQGAWITAANAATYIGADAVHPTDAGHVYLSRRIYGALRALMPA